MTSHGYLKQTDPDVRGMYTYATIYGYMHIWMYTYATTYFIYIYKVGSCIGAR